MPQTKKCPDSLEIKAILSKYRDFSRGAHLLAHTWASRPALIFGFLTVSPMEDASLIVLVRALWHGNPASSIGSGVFAEKLWFCPPSEQQTEEALPNQIWEGLFVN